MPRGGSVSCWKRKKRYLEKGKGLAQSYPPRPWWVHLPHFLHVGHAVLSSGHQNVGGLLWQKRKGSQAKEGKRRVRADASCNSSSCHHSSFPVPISTARHWLNGSPGKKRRAAHWDHSGSLRINWHLDPTPRAYDFISLESSLAARILLRDFNGQPRVRTTYENSLRIRSQFPMALLPILLKHLPNLLRNNAMSPSLTFHLQVSFDPHFPESTPVGLVVQIFVHPWHKLVGEEGRGAAQRTGSVMGKI